MNYRSEIEALAEGLDVNRYYDGWRIVVMLWRGIWSNSSIDWSRYRLDIWSMFTDRVISAARTSSDLDGFFARSVRLLGLRGIGANEDDRQELTRLLALDDRQRQLLMRQLREDTTVFVALLRRWRDVSKAAKALEKVEIEAPKEETEIKGGLFDGNDH